MGSHTCMLCHDAPAPATIVHRRDNGPLQWMTGTGRRTSSSEEVQQGTGMMQAHDSCTVLYGIPVPVPLPGHPPYFFLFFSGTAQSCLLSVGLPR